MSEKKNIDRLFQENFKDFEVTPDDRVWENIHNSLHKDKRKRRIIPIWWQLAGVAALLALLFTVGNIIFNPNDNNPSDNSNTIVDTKTDNNSSNNSTISKNKSENKIVNTNDTDNTKIAVQNSSENNVTKDSKNNSSINSVNQKSNDVVNSSSIQNNTSNTKNNSISQKSTEIISNTKSDVANTTLEDSEQNKNEIIKSENEINKLIKDSKNDVNSKVAKTIDDKQTEKEEEKISLIKEQENAIENAIAENIDMNEKEEEKLNRWSISSNVAPVYFNTTSDGSSIHSQFNNNSKNSDVSLSYGIAGSYKINKKIKIRAGINKVNLNQSTQNIIALSGVNARNVDINDKTNILNIDFNSEAQNMLFLSAENISFSTAPGVVNTNPKATLDQEFGFIEVPIEAEYTILDKKLGISFIGGFSTFFLSNNDVYATLEDERTLVGEANNINSVSYSANIGLGVNYTISKKINLNLEPMFKYQINTFSNTSGDFQPYFIGVYTGLSFRF